MEVRIQSIHFDATDQLQAFINKKLSKLDKFHDINDVEVTLRVVKPETANNKEAGIKIMVTNAEFYAEKICDSFEQAVDESVEALSRQLTKHKEKLRNK